MRCHQPGGPAPFHLTTYQDVAKRRAFIGAVVESGTMPPALSGEIGAHVAGAAAMTEQERRHLQDWIASGAPKGDCEDPPLKAATGSARPDVRLRLDKSWTMPTEGGRNWGRRTRDKRTFVVPTGAREPLRVQAMTVTSTALEAVHAITLAADTQGRGRWMDEREEGVGYRMIVAVLTHVVWRSSAVKLRALVQSEVKLSQR